MNKRNLNFISLVAGLALVGCATMRPLASPTAPHTQVPAAAAVGHATVLLTLQVTTPRQVQVVVSPYTAASIARLDVVPYIESAANIYQPISSVTGLPTNTSDPNILMVSQASPSIFFDTPISLSNLKANTNYRIYALAYDSEGTRISTTDAYSYVNIQLGDDESPATPTRLPLKLIDRPFSAGASFSLTAVGSGISDLASVSAKLYTYPFECYEQPVLGIALTITPTQIPRSIELSNLKPNRRYRVKYVAYNQYGSVMARDYTDIPVTNDTDPQFKAGPLHLFRIETITGGTYATDNRYVDGALANARFYFPEDLVVSHDGTIFIADTGNNCIRKISGNTVSTLCGATTEGFIDGTGSSARFFAPSGICLGPDGNLYVADRWNHAIRKVTLGGVVTTVAGGNGHGFRDGIASQAQFYKPGDLIAGDDGSIFVADTFNQRIRVISNGTVNTFSGSGTPGNQDGSPTSAMLSYPQGITFDNAGNLIVGDASRVSRISMSGDVIGVLRNEYCPESLGYQTGISIPSSVAVDKEDNIIVSSYTGNRIVKITPGGKYSVLVGSGADRHTDGIGLLGEIYKPRGIFIDKNGVIYLADSGDTSAVHSQIRKIY